MPELPARPDLDQLRHQAKDLLREARSGDDAAVARIRAVSEQQTLASAQLALAREYGFASWPRLATEVRRRAILDARDVERLRALLVDEPEQATATMEHWCDHPKGASPLAYVAMLRYDTARDLWRDAGADGSRRRVPRGAPVDGEPGDRDAAHHGGELRRRRRRVLIAAGHRREVVADSAAAGGTPLARGGVRHDGRRRLRRRRCRADRRHRGRRRGR
jgi:hypothetical protein